MSLEQFIKDKTWAQHQKKLSSVRSNFELMIPDSRAYHTAMSRPIDAQDFKNYADANGSNILTDMFGLDFKWTHSSQQKVVCAFVQILMLAYNIDVKSSLFNPEALRKSDLDEIGKKIMEQMESAIPDDEPETSITIKGRGIQIDEC